MWKEGTIRVPKEENKGEYTVCHYWVKHYEEPSVYGIDEGKISKLMIRIEGRTVCNYDRGWDITPTCREAEIAMEILMQKYN